MARKARVKRTLSNNAAATIDDVQTHVKNRWFWQSRERWLSGDDDKTLVRAIRDGLIPPPWTSRPKNRKVSKARKDPDARQRDRVARALGELYPEGVTDKIPTTVVRKKVTDHLHPETKKLGLTDPSWDTVNRALGRNTNTK